MIIVRLISYWLIKIANNKKVKNINKQTPMTVHLAFFCHVITLVVLLSMKEITVQNKKGIIKKTAANVPNIYGSVIDKY